MDETDRHLLSRLRENARESTASLGRALGLSRTTVQSRIGRLERSGTISGYTVRIAEAHEQGLIRALVMITVRPRAAAGVEAALRKLPDVRALHSVAGPFDMIAEVATGAIKDMDALIDRIGDLEGVERTTSSVILSSKFER
jgi:DNA-binding Lrp family transcriptional regulator